MGENARLKNGHALACRNASVLKTHRRVEILSEASLSIGRQRVGAFGEKLAFRKKCLLNTIVYSGMQEPLACRSAC